MQRTEVSVCVKLKTEQKEEGMTDGKGING